jgi:hypothetical protein
MADDNVIEFPKERSALVNERAFQAAMPRRRRGYASSKRIAYWARKDTPGDLK